MHWLEKGRCICFISFGDIERDLTEDLYRSMYFYCSEEICTNRAVYGECIHEECSLSDLSDYIYRAMVLDEQHKQNGIYEAE